MYTRNERLPERVSFHLVKLHPCCRREAQPDQPAVMMHYHERNHALVIVHINAQCKDFYQFPLVLPDLCSSSLVACS